MPDTVSAPQKGLTKASRVARLLGVSKTTLIRMVKREELRGVQTRTGRWYFFESEIDRYLEKLRRSMEQKPS